MFRYQQGYGYYFPQNSMHSLNMGNGIQPIQSMQSMQPMQPAANYPFFPPPAPYQQPIHNFQQGNVNSEWPYQQGIPNPYNHNYQFGKKGSAAIFQNPLEPKESHYGYSQTQQNQMNFNPYPRPNPLQKQNGGFSTIMSSFKGQDGNFDLNKVMNTAGQMMNALNQVSSMVKGLGGLFK